MIDPGVVYVLSYGDVDWQDVEYASKTFVQTHNTPTDWRRHMKYKAAQDEDDVSSSPLLKSLQQFLASGRRLYTNTPMSIKFEN